MSEITIWELCYPLRTCWNLVVVTAAAVNVVDVVVTTAGVNVAVVGVGVVVVVVMKKDRGWSIATAFVHQIDAFLKTVKNKIWLRSALNYDKSVNSILTDVTKTDRTTQEYGGQLLSVYHQFRRALLATVVMLLTQANISEQKKLLLSPRLSLNTLKSVAGLTIWSLNLDLRS